MGLDGVRRAVFVRHSHPLSAWSRFVTTPFLLAPFWAKKAAVTGVVVAWFAINPVMTPAPEHQERFATRAMLGEEIWAADPGRDRGVVALNVAGSICLAGAVCAAWHRRAVPAGLSTAGSMALTMLCWRRYAAIYDADQEPGDLRGGPADEADGLPGELRRR